MLPRRTFIFDFDGTIGDSLNTVLEIYNRVAPGFNCKPVKPEDHHLLQEKRPQEFMSQYGVTRLKLPFMVLKIRRELNREMVRVKPFPGITGALRLIKERRCRAGILTTNSGRNIRYFLELHNLQKYIDFIHTGVFAFGKHRSLKRIMAKERLAPEYTVCIGDETRDIEAARKAGLAVCAVSWGYNHKPVLEEMEPDYSASTGEEFLQVIDGLTAYEE